MTESTLITDKHYLICHNTRCNSKELDYVKSHFCGLIIDQPSTDVLGGVLANVDCDTIVYFAGDFGDFWDSIKQITGFRHQSFKPFVIAEVSCNYHKDDILVKLGSVPISVYKEGLYIREFFEDDKNYFNDLKAVHQFQILTESNKPSPSFRKGVYLSHVKQDAEGNATFHLLRCSTNLDGPTDGFKAIDREIVQKVRNVAETFFQNAAPLNHTLAQVYENGKSKAGPTEREKKARIKSHSDKTKDMPRNGLIAFCTFYSDEILDKSIKESPNDPFDRVYKNSSVLTQLRFKLKKGILAEGHVKEFSILLYPRSVFIIPLSTNRLYTHEIAPPQLPADKIPTRLGYVIRCSNTEAIHKDGKTFIKMAGQNDHHEDHFPLQKPTEENVEWLKNLYYEENTTDNVVAYGTVCFSLNEGDYQMPNA
ncbi:hypothetical protein BC832DRAFT_403465 [Gaertneriomyces semiglobifer]|nr:hypothetical protein BC832DRAFT_403465 [Gaertneriomyces semiglobifer]